MDHLVGYTDSHEFSKVIGKLRSFFNNKGFLEVHTQSRPAIMSGCEDPKTISSFQYLGKSFPLPQTGQMWLEWEMLKKPTIQGMYTLTTSYRNEPTAKNNDPYARRQSAFALLDFELQGGYDSLLSLENELCEYLGYGSRKTYGSGDYLDVAKKYGVEELDDEHEEALAKEYGPVYFLQNFPTKDAFWNMKRDGNIAKKCDVLLSGWETIGSAERSCNPEEMLRDFYYISDGKYAETLFNLFGKDRVMHELNNYLKLPMIKRSGGGIGVTRLIRSMKKENLI